MNAAELDRQRLLLERLFAESLPIAGTGDRAMRGLRAYRANADASAARALAGALPTLARLVGDDDFARLARDFWRAQPPSRGDLGEWGEGFAAWIESQPRLADWPYLADCARLDWALHRCERAADTTLDTESIARLGDTDPSRLIIELAAGLALIESRWPIATIHAGHRSQDDRAFDAAREAIAERRAETVRVARQGWKAVPAIVDAATARWTRSLLDGADVGIALEQAGTHFDFGAWLAAALAAGWLKGIRVLPD
ncbi:MAG TPA: DNA-binding domain-containing protein [Albitalea sp.]|jgi:hypothetical protein|nr:DNA-binding domain-containing protein [Albitalea sp.]